MENMFCNQCQETAGGKGCTIKGVCGKDSQTADLMDLLIAVCKEISVVSTSLHEKKYQHKEVNAFLLDAIFSTITNANFDKNSIRKRITKGILLKKELLSEAQKRGLSFLPVLPK